MKYVLFNSFFPNLITNIWFIEINDLQIYMERDRQMRKGWRTNRHTHTNNALHLLLSSFQHVQGGSQGSLAAAIKWQSPLSIRELWPWAYLMDCKGLSYISDVWQTFTADKTVWIFEQELRNSWHLHEVFIILLSIIIFQFWVELKYFWGIVFSNCIIVFPPIWWMIRFVHA
jgi:hypothetical protein